LLDIVNLWKSFNSDTDFEIPIFRGFSMSIEDKSCTALIGANGCGKSTLLNLISGTIKADQGQILLKGKDIAALPEEERALQIGRVHQNPSMGVAPSLTILENLSLAHKKGETFNLKKLIRGERLDMFTSLLKDLDLGLENKLNTQVRFLSGGQRQSLSLVMAAMKHPDLMLLDEHTAALDPKTSHVVMEKTRELLDKYHITTVMVSHNMEDAIKYSQRVVMLDNGNIVLDKLSKDTSKEELLSIYQSKIHEKIIA
jgi:putative ABC transport system ATP-binding protein